MRIGRYDPENPQSGLADRGEFEARRAVFLAAESEDSSPCAWIAIDDYDGDEGTVLFGAPPSDAFVRWPGVSPRTARRLRRREAADQLRGLERDVELRRVADAVELDPVGVGEPLGAVADRRGRPGEELVGRAPHDPDGAGDPLGVEVPVEVLRGVEEGWVRRGRRLRERGEQVGRDVLVVRRDQGGRATAALGRGEDRVEVRQRGLRAGDDGPLEAEELAREGVRARPAARRRQRDDAPSAPSLRQPQRDVPAERVAGEVGGVDARVVQRSLDGAERIGAAPPPG